MAVSRTSLRWVAIGLAVVAIAAAGWRYQSNLSKQAFYLLTPAEVAERAGFEEDPSTRGFKLTRAEGPKISFASPNRDVLASPVNIDVNISPRDGVPVDMKSIRIDYKMGPGWINVTRRIMKHASVSGSRLYAKSAELPAGRHTMRLTINDSSKRQTQALVSFVVQ